MCCVDECEVQKDVMNFHFWRKIVLGNISLYLQMSSEKSEIVNPFYGSFPRLLKKLQAVQ
jgi:hypothetical protein